MVDFHSHILPHMDDGAKDINESLALLRMTKEQKISGIIATPHFYPEKEEPDAFLHRREKSMKMLYDALVPGLPDIYIGAEVAYFGGMGRSEKMKELAILGTRTILVEMPFTAWPESVVMDMRLLSDKLGLLPVIAHIERYISFQDKRLLYSLLDNGVRIQSNGAFFTGFFTRRRALGMLSANEIHFLGSDSHNTTTRPQTLGNALYTIAERLGEGMVDYITETTELQLTHAVTLQQYFQKLTGQAHEKQ